MNTNYRRKIIAGNWKMNKPPRETKEYIVSLKPIIPKVRKCDIAVCVPTICIPAAVQATRDSRIRIGAENCNAASSGVYTGEISADMLADVGCKYVIIGHSERRKMGETDADVNAKVMAALKAGLIPIMCCGENLIQREAKITAEYIGIQIKLGLAGIPEEMVHKIIYAYEPVWTIGTGLTATPEQAEEICKLIRTTIRKTYNASCARHTSILYGGPINENNAFDFFAQPDIDGGLIGDASLIPEKFAKIIEAANQ